MGKDPIKQLIFDLEHYKDLSEGERIETAEQARVCLEALIQPPFMSGTFSRKVEDLAEIYVGNAKYFVPLSKKMELKKGHEIAVALENYAIIKDLGERETGGVGVVSEILEGNKAVISFGSSNSVVATYGLEQEIELYSRVKLDPSLSAIIETLPKKESLEYCIESNARVEWGDVGGMDKIIEHIRNAVEMPHLHPEKYQKYGLRPPKGLLLYGPPGCGKTYVVKALVNDMFKKTKEKGETPAVIVFWDEADALLPTRGSGISLSSGGTMSDTIVPQFLSLIDGAEALTSQKVYSMKPKRKEDKPYFFRIRGPEILSMWVGESERVIREIYQSAKDHSQGNPVITILATNRPDKLDPAVVRPGRIDLKIKVDRPNREAGKEILEVHFKEGLPIKRSLMKEYRGYRFAREHLIEEVIKYIYDQNKVLAYAKMKDGQTRPLTPTAFISGAKIENIVYRASTSAFLRDARTGRGRGVSAEDFREAVTSSFEEDVELLIEGNQDRVKWSLILGEEARDMKEIIRKEDKMFRRTQRQVI